MSEGTKTRFRLSFGRYDEQFLEKSWQWLHDPEIKRLTMTPDFTREDQLRWFARLPEMTDYRIWGISCGGQPVGALGLKHILGDRAEYWGYIGERHYWGGGLGEEMMEFIFVILGGGFTLVSILDYLYEKNGGAQAWEGEK